MVRIEYQAVTKPATNTLAGLKQATTGHRTRSSVHARAAITRAHRRLAKLISN